MTEQNRNSNAREVRTRTVPTAFHITDDGALVELLSSPKERATSLAVWRDGTWRRESSVVLRTGEQLVPYSPDNNLLKSRALVLPAEPEEYESDSALIEDIQRFIHCYVDVAPLYEKLAAYYVLFSWVYDAFNDVPYLRVRGDFGTGKTRFLLTVGSLCYKAFFASGASTVSPIFHTLDAFRGTFVLDEADFRFSDEKAEIVKILNNGNVRGMPVLRTIMNSKREFNPQAFHVFGPKIVATRNSYNDRALESRFITIEMGRRRLREDIPINLPPVYEEEAYHLRNRLLLYRFRNRATVRPTEALVDRAIEPRFNQIFVPLLAVVDNEQARKEIREVSHSYHAEMAADRGLSVEAQLLEVLHEFFSDPSVRAIAVKDIAARFAERFGSDFQRAITPKWVGMALRRRLHLMPNKSHGVFVIPATERPRLEFLFDRYGITANASSSNAHSGKADTTVSNRMDMGDVGDIDTESV